MILCFIFRTYWTNIGSAPITVNPAKESAPTKSDEIRNNEIPNDNFEGNDDIGAVTDGTQKLDEPLKPLPLGIILKIIDIKI